MNTRRVATLFIVSISLACVQQSFGQSTTRVSLDSNGVQGSGASQVPALSADGRYVAFQSDAPNLVPADLNGALDVFVRDCLTGTTERVSLDSAGIEGNGMSQAPSISADGRFVAFQSDASNLVPGDTNGKTDVFVRDRLLGITRRMSVSSGGVQSTGSSEVPSISADGRLVAFQSEASDLVAGDINGTSDVFVRDRFTGTTERVSIDSFGAEGNAQSVANFSRSISADGRFVVFSSNATNLVPSDTNGWPDVFVHDRQSGATELASIATGGAQGNSMSDVPAVSGDGRFVAFRSHASNLVPAGLGGSTEVFVHDRLLGTTECVSLDSAGAQGNGSCYIASLSADGRYVAFQSDASSLIPNDTNLVDDIFVRDRQNGLTQRVSVSATGSQATGASYYGALSADGRFVAFQSLASNLVAGDTNSVSDIFLRDHTCGCTLYTYCTAKTNSLGCVPAIGYSGLPTLSGPDSFYVTASNVLNQKSGMMLWAGAQANIPFHGGILCLSAPIVRTPIQNSGGSPSGSDCSGTYSRHFTQAYMAAQFLGPGSTVCCQYWSRDPGFAQPNNIGLTDGLQFVIGP